MQLYLPADIHLDDLAADVPLAHQPRLRPKVFNGQDPSRPQIELAVLSGGESGRQLFYDGSR